MVLSAKRRSPGHTRATRIRSRLLFVPFLFYQRVVAVHMVNAGRVEVLDLQVEFMNGCHAPALYTCDVSMAGAPCSDMVDCAHIICPRLSELMCGSGSPHVNYKIDVIPRRVFNRAVAERTLPDYCSLCPRYRKPIRGKSYHRRISIAQIIARG